jgi:Transposase and inactivated derivatives
LPVYIPNPVEDDTAVNEHDAYITSGRDRATRHTRTRVNNQIYDSGVATVYAGDLVNVLPTHWSVEVDEKTHQFWVYRPLIDRLATTAEEYGITIILNPEAHTTAECLECGEWNDDVFRCLCGRKRHTGIDVSRSHSNDRLV